MTLASWFTVSRLFLIPFAVYFLARPDIGSAYAAVGILLLSAGTDVVDGYLARRRNEVSEFGRIMDPVADKLMVLSAAGALAFTGRLPGWLLGLLLAKELAQMLVGLLFWARHKPMLTATRLGKSATVVLYLGVIAISLGFAPGGLLVALGIALSFAAGANYLLMALDDRRSA